MSATLSVGVAVSLAVVGLTGCNVLAPVLAEGADLVGFVEQVRPDGQELTDSGTISFADDDDAALIHSVSVEPLSVDVLSTAPQPPPLGDPPRPPAPTAPEGTLSAVLTTDNTAGGPAVVTWTYSVDNELVRGLRNVETQVEVFRISIGDGVYTTTADITVSVAGVYDRVRARCRPSGPADGTLLDFNDPNPTTWDAAGCYTSPDGYALQHSWTATSTAMIPAHPAFISNADVTSVSVGNSEWGYDSMISVRLVVFDAGGGPTTDDYHPHYGVTDLG